MGGVTDLSPLLLSVKGMLVISLSCLVIGAGYMIIRRALGSIEGKTSPSVPDVVIERRHTQRERVELIKRDVQLDKLIRNVRVSKSVQLVKSVLEKEAKLEQLTKSAPDPTQRQRVDTLKKLISTPTFNLSEQRSRIDQIKKSVSKGRIYEVTDSVQTVQPDEFAYPQDDFFEEELTELRNY